MSSNGRTADVVYNTARRESGFSARMASTLRGRFEKCTGFQRSAMDGVWG